jgi:hypothetical protein
MGGFNSPQARGVARPLRTAGSIGSWLDSWNHTSQNHVNTLAQSFTAQVRELSSGGNINASA